MGQVGSRAIALGPIGQHELHSELIKKKVFTFMHVCAFSNQSTLIEPTAHSQLLTPLCQPWAGVFFCLLLLCRWIDPNEQKQYGCQAPLCIICISFEGVSRPMRASSPIFDDHGSRIASSLNVCLYVFVCSSPRWRQQQQLSLAQQRLGCFSLRWIPPNKS